MNKTELKQLRKIHKKRYKDLNKKGFKVFSLVAEINIFTDKGIETYNLNE